MKQRAWLLIAGLGAIVIAFALFTLPANNDSEFAGYMEADLVLVGSEQGGRVATLAVEEGDKVKATIIDLRPELHLFDDDVPLVFSGIMCLPGLLVLVLAVVQDAADWRSRLRSDLDEVQLPFPRYPQCLGG